MNTKRMRSRYHRSSNGGGTRHQNGQVSFNRNHVFDSNGPDGRIRGTAQQLCEKYTQHGRDALSSGDRVAAESFFQFAEHYSRLLNSMNQTVQQRHRPAQVNNLSESQIDTDKVILSEDFDDNKPAEEIVTDPSEENQPVIIDIPVEIEPVLKPRPARRGRPSTRALPEKIQQENE